MMEARHPLSFTDHDTSNQMSTEQLRVQPALYPQHPQPKGNMPTTVRSLLAEPKEPCSLLLVTAMHSNPLTEKQ